MASTGRGDAPLISSQFRRIKVGGRTSMLVRRFDAGVTGTESRSVWTDWFFDATAVVTLVSSWFQPTQTPTQQKEEVVSY